MLPCSLCTSNCKRKNKKKRKKDGYVLLTVNWLQGFHTQLQGKALHSIWTGFSFWWLGCSCVGGWSASEQSLSTEQGEAACQPRSRVTWRRAETLSTQATPAELELWGQPSPDPFPPECDEASKVSPAKEHRALNQFHALVLKVGNKHILWTHKPQEKNCRENTFGLKYHTLFSTTTKWAEVILVMICLKCSTMTASSDTQKTAKFIKQRTFFS